MGYLSYSRAFLSKNRLFEKLAIKKLFTFFSLPLDVFFMLSTTEMEIFKYKKLLAIIVSRITENFKNM